MTRTKVRADLQTKVGADLQVGPAAATRRSFMAIAGAAISAPVAAAVASPSWLPPSGGSSDALAARLGRLEDLNEIRALNQALFSDPSSAQLDPGIRGVSPVGFGEHDVIEVADDRRTATARLRVTLHTETAIGPECTVVEMARLQGGGVVARDEQGVLENLYERRDGVWNILSSTAKPV